MKNAHWQENLETGRSALARDENAFVPNAMNTIRATVNFAYIVYATLQSGEKAAIPFRQTGNLCLAVPEGIKYSEEEIKSSAADKMNEFAYSLCFRTAKQIFQQEGIQIQSDIMIFLPPITTRNVTLTCQQ